MSELTYSASSPDERAALLALVRRSDGEWHRIAAMVEEVGSTSHVFQGRWSGFESFDTQWAEDLAQRVTDDDLGESHELIRLAAERGATLVTVLDETYPSNLREVVNRPPFLFVRGELIEADNTSVAVVGTRQASREGLAAAESLARQLAEQDVAVLSGLAAGIDGAAHRAALDAGGRTVAVMGTGIYRIYPKGHEALAERIVHQGGALVSQFWPDSPPTKFSFPMRNAVMSGMAIGTAVIEASSTSGAKMQARLALEHGKRLFLLRELVSTEDWAKRYAEHKATTVVDSVDDILPVLKTTMRRTTQLSLA